MARILRDTYMILEATKTLEYASLSAENKAIYALIVSAGRVDISKGSHTRKDLWNMFDADSVTRRNLKDLYPEESGEPEEPRE